MRKVSYYLNNLISAQPKSFVKFNINMNDKFNSNFAILLAVFSLSISVEAMDLEQKLVAESARWKFYLVKTGIGSGDGYVDVGNVSYNGTVNALVKMIGSGENKGNESLFHYEVKCKTKEYHEFATNDKWKKPSPTTVSSDIVKAICD